MKKLIITLALVIFTSPVFTQTYNMKIEQGTGSAYAATTSIDKVTFLNTTTTPFVCGDVVLHGGMTYETVSIGDQCWFQKNLNIGTRVNGNTEQTKNSIVEKYCYNDMDANCTTYGGLYQWGEAMGYVTTEGAQGICPDGWHIPTIAELQILGTSGNALKAVGQGSGLGIGTNTSGFSGLLAGSRYYDGDFGPLGISTSFWSSTENSAANASRLFVGNDDDHVNFYDRDKDGGFSVRCLKD